MSSERSATPKASLSTGGKSNYVTRQQGRVFLTLGNYEFEIVVQADPARTAELLLEQLVHATSDEPDHAHAFYATCCFCGYVDSNRVIRERGTR